MEIAIVLFSILLFENYAQRAIKSFDYFQSNISTKFVALTFDDGPHGLITPLLLDILKSQGAKATFFVMGVKIDSHQDILLRMVSEGHEIGNHGWNHPIMSKLSMYDLHNQLNRTSEAILVATQYRYSPTIMRPPYGNTNHRLNKHIIVNEGLEVIMWSLDTLDWKRPAPNIIGITGVGAQKNNINDSNLCIIYVELIYILYIYPYTYFKYS
jgi:peptidoglycan/xylan/chitin deacetylase (PgdA/CDA1 family)